MKKTITLDFTNGKRPEKNEGEQDINNMENIEEEKEYERKRIGKRIAEIRKIKGISQAKLAEITGMTPGNIARIELGKYSTGIDILSKIAEGLGYQLDFIKKSVQQIPSDRESWEQRIS